MKTLLTVRYISGREERFEVDFWGGARAEVRLKEYLKSPNLALRTATELIIIPGSAVESISIALPDDEQGRSSLASVRPATRLS